MAQKRRDLLEASRVEGDDAKSSKLSSKKKKRLDSYINKKLKKDRRVELLKELEYVHQIWCKPRCMTDAAVPETRKLLSMRT